MKIYSFSDSNLNPDIAIYQKKVFDCFGLEIKQIIEDDFDHGRVITNILKDHNQEDIIIFDVDCIPLSVMFLNRILLDIKDKNTLSGVVGCANHIDAAYNYIHPSFMAFNYKLYIDCNKPCFNEEGFDVGGLFTYKCLLENKNLKFWNITTSVNKKWKTACDVQFGNGTVYENLIYHQYQIRNKDQQEDFINKCKQVICK